MTRAWSVRDKLFHLDVCPLNIGASVAAIICQVINVYYSGQHIRKAFPVET